MNPGPIRFPPDPALLKQVRSDVRQRALDLGVADAAGDAVALVIDELVNNAIEHGVAYRRIGVDLTVVIGLESGRLTIEFVDPEMPDQQVRDLASALREVAGGIPSLDSERGRGLFLVAIYMEELRVDIANGGGLHLSGRLAVG